MEFFIVMDIERNFRPYESDAPSDIIDIGAVKIEAASMKVVDTFSSFVKPNASISRHTTKLTGITKDDVKGAERFPQVLARFRKFVGEDVMFVTWGKEDYAFMEADCRKYGLSFPMKQRFDLQRFIFNAYEEVFPQQPNLKLATEQLGLIWEGEQHRALSDAINTANLLMLAAKQKDLSKVYKRTIPFVLVKDAKLTDKGRKTVKRWVFKAMKRKEFRKLSWSDFLASKTWVLIEEQYEFDEMTMKLIEAYFPVAWKKSKQQLEVLAQQKKDANASISTTLHSDTSHQQ
jgi:inhibitor of KinA sporulation pathway (predicted exonuclease)